jgi:peptidoglycan/LPS O-acetylase OafA/YrhL
VLTYRLVKPDIPKKLSGPLFPLIPLWAGIKLPGLIYTEHAATTGFWIGVGYCLIYMILVFAVASLTYFTIEKPCRKYIKARWGKENMPVYA